MFRKLMIAIAATVVIGAAAIPTSASAYWHGGGGWHGGWHGGWRGPGWGYRPYAYVGGPYYYGGCYRNTHVWTPYGWRWHRIWVCG